MPAPANQRPPKLSPARLQWFCAASAAATSALVMLALAAARLLIPTPSLAALIGALAFAVGFAASLFKRSIPHGDFK
jgi:hypothetical protein